MEQTVKQAGYPDVQSFAKTYQKSEKLVREYNEGAASMEKSDRTEKREAIRTVEKGKHTGKIAPLSAGKQATAKTDSKEEINGQRDDEKGGTENEENNF